jgi:hypothetical protein
LLPKRGAKGIANASPEGDAYALAKIEEMKSLLQG